MQNVRIAVEKYHLKSLQNPVDLKVCVTNTNVFLTVSVWTHCIQQVHFALAAQEAVDT